MPSECFNRYIIYQILECFRFLRNVNYVHSDFSFKNVYLTKIFCVNIGDFTKVEQCKYSDSKYTNSLKKDLGSLGKSIQLIYVNTNKSTKEKTKEKTKVKTKDAYNKLDLNLVSRYCSNSLSHFIKCKLKML